ncbi:penicillin-binding protein activator [Erwinia tasmaniensis]|uniref:Penicillin-binding protein activator LpoA n=1 Tax=Erwinia tasmaniensis (strain DSM 17950 / CFBP 7177 / CIP 109463 / NCPPB 4357 / Et1/99) TaxID=465817 RepID=LPOA_ERWT9|nr:penicillin-binding protein activator [Erwinia tasmaniensis]B2VDC8.1 RecName: Full=Penicillin-binding protein activator LpoA; Short=PBP activator LpoA; Flags: Precursor [Erwinia tasmaniensis Et1/99]CAO97966.1 Putative lipoprotein [Erwinia tasmaniensis Et1/99]
MLPSKVVHRKAVRTVPLLLAALIFAGCTGQAPHTPPANVQGAADGTSDYYLQQVQQSADDNKVDWQLLAIRALLNEGKLPQAGDALTQLPADLNNIQRQERLLLLARLNVARQNLSGATDPLKQIDISALSQQQQVRYYQLQIAVGQGQPSLDVVRAWVALEPLQTSPADKQKNIDETWQALLQIPQQQINTLTINANENVLQGWLDLLGVYKNNVTAPDMLKSAIQDWQTRYPYNPAAKMLPTSLTQAQNLHPASMGKIALLLPLSGQAQVFANAIQKGFNDAKNGVLAQSTVAPSPAGPVQVPAATPGDAAVAVSPSATTSDKAVAEQPAPAINVTTAAPSASTQIQVYDTSSQPVEQLLTQAQNDGATLAIGPLLKSDVDKMLNSQTALNVLALNEPESVQNRPNICYFALSPEDEARDAAHHMWEQGKRAPLLLVPRTSLGDRVNKAFAAEWQKLGGATVLQQQFGSTAELKQGINSGAGIRLSGTPVNVQPQQQAGVTIAGLTIPAPPTDAQPGATSSNGRVDSVYIVATQDEMILIKPMIAMRISSRDNVGLYASSRSYQAGAGPDYRLELEGLQFSDAPLLSGANPALMQQAAKAFNNDYSLVRLYAMGVDAWTLANHFNEMRNQPGFQIKGDTGMLSANQDCIINRKLVWSQYHQGQIVPGT